MPAKRAIVTGASGGIGLELARLLAQAGYDVILAARSQEKLEALAAELRSSFGIDAQSVALDLSSPGAAHELYARFPSCDVLVNNAGFANNGKFASIGEREMLAELQLDVVALTQLTRLYLPGMLERKDGKILNVASTAAFLPGPNMAVYYASKAYVLSFSEALAEETRGSGVTVTVLCPGATATEFHRRAKMERTTMFRLPLANAAQVAKAGIEGLMRGRAVIVPGFLNKLAALTPKFAPRRLLIAISGKAVERARS